MSPVQQVVADQLTATPSTVDDVDREQLLALLQDKDRLLQELEAECRVLADQLQVFQDEILKWVDFDR